MVFPLHVKPYDCICHNNYYADLLYVVHNNYYIETKGKLWKEIKEANQDITPLGGTLLSM